MKGGEWECKLLRQLLERWARSVWHIDHTGVSTSCLKIRLNERLEDMRESDSGEGSAGELTQFAIEITSGGEEEEEEGGWGGGGGGGEEESASFLLYAAASSKYLGKSYQVSAHASPL